MSWAKLTLTAFESYLNMSGKSLFDELELPEGINKDTLTDNIYLRAGEYEVLYSDPEFIRRAIPVWGRKWYKTFEKWITALNIKYEPLYNYDRHEEWTDEATGGRSNNSSMESKTDRTLESSEESQDEVTNTRSAFDADSYQPHDRSESLGTISSGSSGSDETTGTGSFEENTTDNSQHTGHLYGNIGVTTSQQMLKDELEIAKWNIYEHITDLFIEEFTIPVYE